MPTVAIIGASRNRKKFGNKSVRAHAKAGWTVFHIHPSATRIEQLLAYRSVTTIPVLPIDRISVYLPPAVVIRLLDEITQAQTKEVWLNPGSYDDEVIAIAKDHGLSVVCGCSIIDVGYSPSDFP